MLLIRQYAGNSRYIVVIHKRKKMFSFVQSPVFRPELPHQRMIDLKHIHAVKAGMKSLITFIVCSGMQHPVVHHLVIIPMEHLAHEEKLILLSIRKIP